MHRQLYNVPVLNWRHATFNLKSASISEISAPIKVKAPPTTPPTNACSAEESTCVSLAGIPVIIE